LPTNWTVSKDVIKVNGCWNYKYITTGDEEHRMIEECKGMKDEYNNIMHEFNNIMDEFYMMSATTWHMRITTYLIDEDYNVIDEDHNIIDEDYNMMDQDNNIIDEDHNMTDEDNISGIVETWCPWQFLSLEEIFNPFLHSKPQLVQFFYETLGTYGVHY
jgi:hypothetical protein